MELKTVELTKQYGRKRAVDHMSVTLTAGVYGLLGANGAGKTTLMRLLCALQQPTAGRILLDGKNIEKLGEEYRDLLGYLPQGFGYYPDFSRNRLPAVYRCPERPGGKGGGAQDMGAFGGGGAVGRSEGKDKDLFGRHEAAARNRPGHAEQSAHPDSR